MCVSFPVTKFVIHWVLASGPPCLTRVPALKGSGHLPIPFLFCKINGFCRLLIGVNQLLRCVEKPLISVDLAVLLMTQILVLQK